MSEGRSVTVEGGEESLPNHVTSTYTLPIPTKDFHEFVGWYDNAEGAGEALITIPAGWRGTLYAIWKEIEAEVIWVLNGGKFPEAAVVPTNEELFTKFKFLLYLRTSALVIIKQQHR